MAFVVHRIDGLAYFLGRRDVAFLESDEFVEINARTIFLGLNDKRKKEMLDRFDHWKRADVHHKKYHHHFDEPPDCRDCHVFKRREEHTRYRYYGFKLHPWTSNPRYELCILVNHGQKNQEETDPAELRTVNRYKGRPDVFQAILTAFPDPGGANVALYFGKR